jgi:hypothetical protein
MKTDMLMEIALPQGSLSIYHKSHSGNMTDLFKLGNIQRAKEGKQAITARQILKLEKTQEFLNVVSERLKIPKEEVVKVTGRGRNARTYAQLHFLIYCAEQISPEFHFDVIDIFIDKHILQTRDDGGEHFKELNRVIDLYLPDRENKSSNVSIYIQCAKLLKSKIFTTEEIIECGEYNIWNSKFATSSRLKIRDEYENKLISFLEMNLVKNYEHLKELIGKL